MQINKAEYIISAVKEEGYPKAIGPEFVFMGRSNVGKSSFINALTNRKKLAYTSSKPGKTITLNFYNINDEAMFVDVPGYGYALTSQSERLRFGSMIEEYLKVRKQLKLAFLIVDIRHKPTEDDQLMYKYLSYYQIPLVIIATKSDKIGKTKIPTHLKQIKETLLLNNEVQVIPFSAITKYGLEKANQIIDQIMQSF